RRSPQRSDRRRPPYLSGEKDRVPCRGRSAATDQAEPSAPPHAHAESDGTPARRPPVLVELEVARGGSSSGVPSSRPPALWHRFATAACRTLKPASCIWRRRSDPLLEKLERMEATRGNMATATVRPAYSVRAEQAAWLVTGIVTALLIVRLA